MGRPITDLASDLLYPELADDAREVLRKLLSRKNRSPRATDAGSPCASCPTARSRPIDGVVITFADITVAKTLEAQLRKTHAGLHKQISEQALKLDQR